MDALPPQAEAAESNALTTIRGAEFPESPMFRLCVDVCVGLADIDWTARMLRRSDCGKGKMHRNPLRTSPDISAILSFRLLFFCLSRSLGLIYCFRTLWKNKDEGMGPAVGAKSSDSGRTAKRHGDGLQSTAKESNVYDHQ